MTTRRYRVRVKRARRLTWRQRVARVCWTFVAILLVIAGCGI